MRAGFVAPGERLVVFNSDLLASAHWMARFLIAAAATDEQALIGVDLERQLTDESMKVSTKGDGAYLDRIGKKDVPSPAGEYVGMLMAGGTVLESFRRELEGFVDRPESANEWYERGVGLSVASGAAWRIWPTPSSDWVEIDDDADYALAGEIALRL